MSFRNFLIPILPGERLEERLDAVLPLATRLGAQMDVLLLSTDPVLNLAWYAGCPLPSASLEELRWRAQETIDSTRRGFDQWREERGVPETSDVQPSGAVCASFTIRLGAPDYEVVRRGRLADLVVLARPDDEGGPSSNVLDAAIFESGRPVLLLPPEPLLSIPVLGRVAVAWNGSLQSARAVQGAMPLLEKADHVVVIGDAEGTEPIAYGQAGPMTEAKALTGAFRRHGIDATAREFSVSGYGDVGEALLREVQNVGATMLVMGAFTHSRVRQMFFGGVTRHMFRHATIPLLVSN